MRKLQSCIIRTQSICRLSFSLHLFSSVYWSPAAFWTSEIPWGKLRDSYRPFLLGAYIHSFPGDILIQIHIKNNACKIELNISTLKSAFPSGILISVNDTSIPLVPKASNMKLLSFTLPLIMVLFAFQIPFHLFFSIPTSSFTPHYL